MERYQRQPSYMPSLDRRLTSLSPAAILPHSILELFETNVTQAHADSTEREVRQWEIWCEAYDHCALPIHDPDVLVYMYERYLFGARLRTLRGIYTALNTYQVSNGIPRTDSGLIRSFFRAVGRKEVIVRATPCTPDDVALMCGLARQHGGMRALRDVALLLYLWESAERISEVARTEDTHVESRRLGALVHIPRSKNDQAGRGAYILIERNHDQEFCALHALERWVAAAGIRNGLVFRRITRTDKVGSPLSTSGIYHIIKAYLRAIDLPGKCTTYSFRRGWATNAFLENVPLEKIRERLRHEDSKTTKVYIDNPIARMREFLMPYRRMIS